MSRFRKLSHTLWHYHIVWVPKYRHKILKGNIANEVGNCIKAFSEQKHVEILEMNIQPDHIHLITIILYKSRNGLIIDFQIPYFMFFLLRRKVKIDG